MSSSSSSSSSLLRFVKLSIHAQTPTRGSSKAACLDFYSASSTTLPARGKELVFTDLQIQPPDGCYGRFAPRLGLALNHHVHVGGGVIDRDYRGNVGVLIYNHSDTHSLLHKGTVSRSLYVKK